MWSGSKIQKEFSTNKNFLSLSYSQIEGQESDKIC